jgi:hypothetical protein
LHDTDVNLHTPLNCGLVAICQFPVGKLLIAQILAEARETQRLPPPVYGGRSSASFSGHPRTIAGEGGGRCAGGPTGDLRGCSDVADEVVCAITPKLFTAVGAAYEDFEQTSDEKVSHQLRAFR